MKKIIPVSFIFTAVLFSSCTSTHITSSWREPDKEVAINKLNKVLVVALLRNETSRHTAEDEMVNFLHGKGVASYGYLDNDISTRNEDAIRDKIKGDDFDGAITMRLVDVDKDITYTPGNFQSYPTYYRSFSGYYFRSWSYYSTPARYTTTKTYTVETNVYSIKEDRIIWSGLTETTNPDGVDKMTREIVKVVYRHMVKEGFITE